jgi:hypothetical protein
MRFTGASSWQASEGMPQALMTALYLRDAAGLEVRAATVVPPLEPRVDLDAGLALYATEDAASDWVDWWESFLDPHPEVSGVPQVLLAPLFELELSGDLRRLIEAGHDDAQSWLHERAHEYVQRRIREPHSNRILITLVTREVEKRLGRRAAPFRLRVSVLPVEGEWGRRVRSGHVLVSNHLRADVEAFRAFIEPVIEDLAGA